MENKRIKGIDTSTKMTQEYCEELFNEVIKKPEEFLESLCTPLERDPRYVLTQLQNAECENEEIMPY